MADPNTGLVRDRADAEEPYAPSAASIAATGFRAERSGNRRQPPLCRPRSGRSAGDTTLKFLCEQAPQERGFFYHFMDSDTGKRIWRSEASSVDTAWLLCGVLHSAAFWENPDIRKYAEELLAAPIGNGC